MNKRLLIFTVLIISLIGISYGFITLGQEKDITHPERSQTEKSAESKPAKNPEGKTRATGTIKKTADTSADFYYQYSLARMDLQNEDYDSALTKLLNLSRNYPESSRVLMSLARVYLLKDNYERALINIKKAIKIKPDNYEAWRIKGEISLAKYRTAQTENELAELKNAFNKVLELNPDDSDEQTLRILSLIYLQEDNWKKAKIYLERLNRYYPGHMFAFQNLEKIYQNEKDDKALLKLYDTYSQMITGDIQLISKTADLSFRMREYDIAERSLNSLIEEMKKIGMQNIQKNTLSMAYRQLGYVYLRKNNYDKALETFIKAREIDDNLYTNIFLIVTLMQQDNYTTARVELNNALKDFATDTRKYELDMLNAQLLQKEGKPEEALRQLESLIKQDPDNVEYKLNKANYYFEERNFVKSEEFLRNVYRDHPTDPRVLFQLGSVSERLQKHKEAEKYFKLTLKLDPDNGAAMNYLGYMWADQGIRLQEAEKMIKKAVDLDPTNSAYLDSLGWVYFKMDKLAKARYYLEKAVAEGVDGGEIFDHLAQLYMKLELYEEAYQNWLKALEENDPNLDNERIRENIENVKQKLAR